MTGSIHTYYFTSSKGVAGKTEAFYFKPLAKPTKDRWFSTLAVGHNTLQGAVKRMCKAAGIEGRKTDHSLRVTSATRLYQKNVDEQLICEQTGKYRSVES